MVAGCCVDCVDCVGCGVGALLDSAPVVVPAVPLVVVCVSVEDDGAGVGTDAAVDVEVDVPSVGAAQPSVQANACPGIARVNAVNEAVATASRQSRARKEEVMRISVTGSRATNPVARKGSMNSAFRPGLVGH